MPVADTVAVGARPLPAARRGPLLSAVRAASLSACRRRLAGAALVLGPTWRARRGGW